MHMQNSDSTKVTHVGNSGKVVVYVSLGFLAGPSSSSSFHFMSGNRLASSSSSSIAGISHQYGRVNSHFAFRAAKYSSSLCRDEKLNKMGERLNIVNSRTKTKATGN